VAFRCDVHPLFFSDDAVGIEAALHQRPADKRLNPLRRFFHATVAEVKTYLAELAGDLLRLEDVPEALQGPREPLAAGAHQSARTAEVR
jgi:hypothetical protein